MDDRIVGTDEDRSSTMYESPGRSHRERQLAHEAHRPSTKPVPSFARSLSRPFGRRHPTGVTIIRSLVAVWLVFLGSVFWYLGQYWGVLFFPLAAAIAALAFLMPRWNRALVAEGDV